MPGLAQPAIQEGQYVARLIRRRILRMKPPRLFGIGIRAISPSSAVLTRLLICDLCALLDFPPGLLGHRVHLFSDWLRQFRMPRLNTKGES
jgi:NADH dehydrogenase FAD-containing subunit